MARSKKSNNVKLAGLFVLFVFSLIFLSLLIKIIFIFKESTFDGRHSFNVAVISKDSTDIISFSPPTRSISILDMDKKMDKNKVIKDLMIPLDGIMETNDEVTKTNLSSIFLKSIFPFSAKVKDLTLVDNFRLFLYTRGVLQSAVYERKIVDNFNQQQRETLIALTFTDPTIYEENQSVEIVNATGKYGFGGRLANLLTNIGTNVILITTSEQQENQSRIIYSGGKTYTVERLEKILSYPTFKENKKSISDVIIIIGNDNKEGAF